MRSALLGALAAVPLVVAAGVAPGALATASETVPAEGFPSFADIVPDDADYWVDDWVQQSDTIKAEGLTVDPYWGHFEQFSLGNMVGEGDEWVEVYPESVTVSFRSNNPGDSFEVWASPLERDYSSPEEPTLDERMDLVGETESDGAVTASFPAEQVRQLAVRAHQAGQVSVLVHSEYADPGAVDRYQEMHIDFGYSSWNRVKSEAGTFELYLEDHEVVGQPMDLGWWGDSIDFDTQAEISVTGPDGWVIYTGNGSTGTSPAQTESRSWLAMLQPTQAGLYTVTVTIGNDSATVPVRADESLDRERWPGPIVAPSEQCVQPESGGPGLMDDPQLLVNGEKSSDVTVLAGEPVTFGWESTPWDAEYDNSVSIGEVWGSSRWQPVGPIEDIPVPDGGVAEATLTFDAPGCNLVRMFSSMGFERYAYVQVEAGDPEPEPTPPPTPETSVAGGMFVPIEPCRLFDTRSNPGYNVGPRNTPIGPAETYVHQVHGENGRCQIPEDAVAVSMNVTAVSPTSNGHLRVFPADASLPDVSNLNWIAGQAPTPNKVDVKLSESGAASFYNDNGTVDVIADIGGYYTDAPVAALEARIAELETPSN